MNREIPSPQSPPLPNQLRLCDILNARVQELPALQIDRAQAMIGKALELQQTKILNIWCGKLPYKD